MLTGTVPAHIAVTATPCSYESRVLHVRSCSYFLGLQTSAPLHHPKGPRPAEIRAREKKLRMIVTDLRIHNTENTNNCERITREAHVAVTAIWTGTVLLTCVV
jgi:hypothetical protein